MPEQMGAYGLTAILRSGDHSLLLSTYLNSLDIGN